MDVLIVEDDEQLNQVMILQLEAAGYEVRSARTGAKALSMIDERLPAILILDVGLPDICGQEVIAKLRENKLTCALPLIVHTTLELTYEDRNRMELGPSRFVTKTMAGSGHLEELVSELITCPTKNR